MRSFASYSNLVEIGRGGMAKVYRANSPTGHLVALKVLALHLANDQSARLRFKQESNLGLQHPNIVRVIESDFDDTRGEPYIVMEYVPSESLEQRLARVKRLAPADVARIITDVARALDYAHEKGIVHRDVKPGNILLRTSNDQALLTDFGIAKTPFATAFTATIARVGSVLYMSPEQANGTPSLTRASDIYSLAVTAYYALSGRHPFESTDPIVVARQHIDARPPHVCDQNPSIPRTVGDVVMQTLSKQPYQRPPSAGRFARLLTEAVQGRSINDPMTKTTATLRMPKSMAGAAASTSPSATLPIRASRTAQTATSPISSVQPPVLDTPYNAPATDHTQLRRAMPLPWILGGIVCAVIVGMLAYLTLGEDSAKVIVPTPTVRRPTRTIEVATAKSQPSTGGVALQASATAASVINTSGPVIKITSTSLLKIIPAQPSPRRPRATLVPVNPLPTLPPAPPPPAYPSPTVAGVFTPVSIPTDTPAPTSIPTATDLATETPLPPVTPDPPILAPETPTDPITSTTS